ncbi:MAG: hypothetical protein WDN24_01730 [Sphingomonas sp.]
MRVGLRRRTPGTAYRVILEEIPRPSKENTIQVALRINLPMYVLGIADGKPAVQWAASRDAAANSSSRAGTAAPSMPRSPAIALVDTAGRRTVLTTSMGVVLPASMRRWKVGRHPELKAGSDLQLSIRSSRGEDRIMARLATR